MNIFTGQSKIITPAKKELFENVYLVGRLLDDEHIFKRAITDDDKGNKRFIIERISTIPSELHEAMGYENTFISYDTRQYNYLANYDYFSSRNKEKKMRDIFKDKVILFKPYLVQQRKGSGGYYFNFEIVLDDVVTQKELTSTFLPVPIVNCSVKEFEQKLLNGNIILFESYNHANPLPTYVICEKTLYYFPQITNLSRYGARRDAYKCVEPEKVIKMAIPKKWSTWEKCLTKHLCFISDHFESTLVKQLKNVGNPLVENVIEEKEDKEELISSQVEVNQSVRSTTTIPEYQLIENVYNRTINKGFMYKRNDIVNLHTSLKTSTITILGGMSGTGKTQLARMYAESLGLTEGETLLTIPVSPSFTEPSDLLGFLNHQTGEYLEAETGLVSFLYKAQQHPDQLHMVIFDEMNIGQVEHYFSDFISLLELPIEHRKLKLFHEQSKCNENHLCQGITIGENVLFVGTANFDETTKDFSNRMLDRSNVILLEKMSFIEAKKHKQEIERKEQEEQTIQLSFSNFQEWIAKEEGIEFLSDKHLAILDALHNEMSEYDSQMGVSFRMVRGMTRFMRNIPLDEKDSPYITFSEAFDYQVKQRILTKIRGHREQIEHLVGYIDMEGEYEEGSIQAILADEESYPVSRLYLKQKVKELVRNGYTL